MLSLRFARRLLLLSLHSSLRSSLCHSLRSSLCHSLTLPSHVLFKCRTISLSAIYPACCASSSGFSPAPYPKLRTPLYISTISTQTPSSPPFPSPSTDPQARCYCSIQEQEGARTLCPRCCDERSDEWEVGRYVGRRYNAFAVASLQRSFVPAFARRFDPRLTSPA